MGGLLAIVLAAGVPPIDDGASCEAWTANRARQLALAPQPPAAPLGADGPGLANLDSSIWSSLAPAVPEYTPQNGERFAAALDGRASILTAPELIAAAERIEPELSALLVAARGSRNRLPAGFQIWSVLDSESSPTTLDLQAGIRLSIARGRKALHSGEAPRAVESCVGVLGLLRASAGTSLIGRMVATAWAQRARSLCLETARLGNPSQREELRGAIGHLGSGWPTFADTLGQELVFAQVAFFAKYWTDEDRSKLPPDAFHLNQAGEKQSANGSWWRNLRRALFGWSAAREQCLLYARAFPVVDSAPVISDPALRAMGEAPLFWRLADWDESPGGSDHWVRLFRRVRGLETELELLRAGLAVWKIRDSAGSWPSSLGLAGSFVDRRTGRPLVLEATGEDAILVARSEPSFGAQEIRVVLSAVR